MGRIVLSLLILIFLFCSKSYAQIEFYGSLLDTDIEARLSMDDINSENGLLYVIDYDSEFEVNILSTSVIDSKFVEVELEMETVLEGGICKIIYLEMDENSSESFFYLLEEEEKYHVDW